MSNKLYSGRRSGRPGALAGLLAALVVPTGLVALERGDWAWLLPALCAAGSVFVLARRKEVIEYELGEGELILRKGASEERLPMEELLDANLIDLVTARDFVEEQSDVAGRSPGQGPAFPVHTHYCGICFTGRLLWGAGLNRTALRNYRETLVLVRTRSGGAILLSPRHSERLVSAMAKALRPDKDGMGRSAA
ncbi:MAG TPA: hypothetical protein PKD45_00385 [Flavobacteriales bacterium]|nr:hypothetical protein [Flavobacteriales bacterium]